MCSDYLDVGTTLNRLVYVVKLLTHNGFYVLLDNQFNLDTTVLDNQNQWLSDWVTLLKAVAQDSISSQMLMIDILNVCQALGCTQQHLMSVPSLAQSAVHCSSRLLLHVSSISTAYHHHGVMQFTYTACRIFSSIGCILHM